MRCRLHYAEKNLLPDSRWRGKEGVVLCRGCGPGPRNALVRTTDGEMVVVPWGNVRAQPVADEGVRRFGKRQGGKQASNRVTESEVFGLKHGGCWFGFGGPFGFGFSFGAPFGWWGSMSVEEELEMLREYRRWLEVELERVNERIRRLGGE